MPETETKDLVQTAVAPAASVGSVIDPAWQLVPKGWKLVPVEPTEEMLKAGAVGSGEDSEGVALGAWESMLSASPTPPEETQDGFVRVPLKPSHPLWVTLDGRGNGVTLSHEQWAELIAAANYPTPPSSSPPAPREVALLKEALEDLLHAVCGETGFANAVRTNSGTAYPWPALDIAEDKARAALSSGDQK